MYEYKAIVKRVIDGDTFDCDIDLGMYVHLHNIRIRVLNVDTYEKFGHTRDIGYQIKNHVASLLEGKEVIIKSYKPDTDLNTDSFGRWLAEVKFGDNLNTDLATYLVEHNFNKDSVGTPVFD